MARPIGSRRPAIDTREPYRPAIPYVEASHSSKMPISPRDEQNGADPSANPSRLLRKEPNTMRTSAQEPCRKARPNPAAQQQSSSIVLLV